MKKRNALALLGLVVAAAAVVLTATVATAPPPRPRPRPRPPKRLPPKKIIRPRLVPKRVPVVVRRVGPKVVVQQAGKVIRRDPVTVVRTFKALPKVVAPTLTETTAYKVLRVADDYTVVVQKDGKQFPVRLLGFSPPESEIGQGAGPGFKQMAARFLGNLLRGEFVHLKYDPSLAEKDEEGTVVAYLYRAPDGLFVNLEAIRQGFGLAPRDYEFQHSKAFNYYEEKAQADLKGFWGRVQAGKTAAPAK